VESSQTDEDEWDQLEIEIPIGSYPNDPTVPDIFVEGVGIQLGLSSVSLVFNRATGYPPKMASVAVIRMTLPQALVMVQVMRRGLKDYQSKVGPIFVPGQMLEPLNLDTEL
jgi:hypothetical protein